MEKQSMDVKRACLERLAAEASKDLIANVLAAESHQIYTRYDLIHKAR